MTAVLSGCIWGEEEMNDIDGDGIEDSKDIFPNNPNESIDSDDDGVGDNSDLCIDVHNPEQADLDGDGL
ncbi:MAG: hypothetical protein HN923_06065, partial [Euryarchaeota archaeon]|nr:hypothetical protein [Euryarchaeota archaeon]